MRIAFIITGLATGGAEMMLLKMLERLDRTRFDPYVISLASLGELAPRIVKLGISVSSMEMERGAFSWARFLRLVRVIKHLKPDVVQTWMYHADLLGGLAARLAGVTAVCWGIRNSNLDKDKTRFATRAVVAACALFSKWLPSRILVCSEMARQFHVGLGYAEGKMCVIPNGFDLGRFKPDSDAKRRVCAELGVSVDVPLVGLIARFDPMKNHLGLVQAAGLLLRRMPHVHFVLAGAGIDSNNQILARSIAEAGLHTQMHLLGLRGDIAALMAALDVLVSASHGEAFPNVLGEAMACGVLCAVTDVGDSAYIVGETGRVVAAGDMKQLALAMEELLTLPVSEKSLLSQQARERVAAHFEIGNVVQRYELFYEKLFADAH